MDGYKYMNQMFVLLKDATLQVNEIESSPADSSSVVGLVLRSEQE